MTRFLEPLGERVVIRPLAREDTTPGGIALPEAAAQPLPIAEVVSMSKDAPRFTIGMRVIYNAFAGLEITLDGDSVIVIPVSDIVAVIRDAKP